MSSDAGSSGDNVEADGVKINKMPSRKPTDRKVTKEWPEVVSALHSLRLSALVESKTNSSSSSQVASIRDINISGSFDVSGIERWSNFISSFHFVFVGVVVVGGSLLSLPIPWLAVG
jgi:hypothetical protein